MSNATEKTTVTATPETPAAESDTLIKFSKPYVFEGQTYTEIDLAGLENLTARDMFDAEKYLFKSGIISPLPDQTSEYICFIAGRVAGQPVEFFKGLPPKDITRVKNKVSSFFYGED